MKPEFRIREVTRYVITRHDDNGTQAVAEVSNLHNAQEICSALENQATVRRADEGKAVESLNIPARAANILKDNNVLTISDLLQKTEIDILKMPNVGAQMLGAIKFAVEQYGGLKKR